MKRLQVGTRAWWGTREENLEGAQDESFGGERSPSLVEFGRRATQNRFTSEPKTELEI